MLSKKLACVLSAVTVVSMALAAPREAGAQGYAPRTRASAVRLDVTPKETEVYVDGYFAGIVDEFDGMFQRLRLAPGEHEIALYLEGYRTARQRVQLTPGSTFKIRYRMEQRAPGEAGEARPAPLGPPPGLVAGRPYPYDGALGRRMPPPQGQPPQAQSPPRPPQGSSYGTLVIRVQPGNATVVIDGERWEISDGPERLVVEVSEGSHRIQIEKAGYEPFSADIQVRRGEPTPVNVSLRTRP